MRIRYRGRIYFPQGVARRGSGEFRLPVWLPLLCMTVEISVTSELPQVPLRIHISSCEVKVPVVFFEMAEKNCCLL